MKAEQRIVIRTYPRRRHFTGNGLIEHAAKVRTVDVFAADAESDDAAGEHIDDHKDPMAARKYGLATSRSSTNIISTYQVKSPPRERDSYSAEEQQGIRIAFSRSMEAATPSVKRRYHCVITGGVFVIVVSAMIFSNKVIVAALVFAYFILAALFVARALASSGLLNCPGCSNVITMLPPFGPYCPECGFRGLQSSG